MIPEIETNNSGVRVIISVMYSQLTGVSRPWLAVFAVLAVGAVASIGATTTSVLVAPLLILCVLATGLFFLSGAELTSIERLVLIPAIGVASLAISSLLIPLTGTLGLVVAPAQHSAVIAVSAALPTALAISYWASRQPQALPSINVGRRLLVPFVPILLGGGGALIQWQFSVVVQNYVVMGLLLVMGPVLLYWSQTEFEAAVALYGIAMGVLFSHTLVTGYSVGIDVQMSLHSIERIIATGNWPINYIFFEVGAEDASLSDLIGYVGSGLAHTSLPVVIGVPIIFNAIGNTTPDFVFDVVFVGLFALTPVAIFRLGREALSVREAFVASMLFIIYYRFFHTSPAKQHLAQFFITALIVAWLTRSRDRRIKTVAALLGVGIVFSHYAVAFLFFIFVSGAYVLKSWFFDHPTPSKLSLPFVSYFYALVALWYVVITGGQKPLAAASAITASINEVVMGGGPQSRTGVEIASRQTFLVDQINVGLHALLLGIIALGVITIMYNALSARKPLFSVEIDSISVGFFSLLILSLFVSGYLGIDRALDISLVVLAPAAILGIKCGFNIISERIPSLDLSGHTYQIGFILIIVMFSFSSGLAYGLSERSATSAINLQEKPNSVMYSGDEYRAATYTLRIHDGATIYGTTFVSTVFHRTSGRSLPYYSNMRDYKSDFIINWEERGYIFIRKSIITDRSYAVTPSYLLERKQYQSFVDRTETVYENEDVIILRIDPSDVAAAGATDETVKTPTASPESRAVPRTQTGNVPLISAV